MSTTPTELIVGDVLVAPFVTYSVAALVILMVVRPLLSLVGLDRIFSNPPVAVLALYVVILAALVLAA